MSSSLLEPSVCLPQRVETGPPRRRQLGGSGTRWPAPEEVTVSVRRQQLLADVVCILVLLWAGGRGRLLYCGPPGIQDPWLESCQPSQGSFQRCAGHVG
jgi:hypothetical protein